MIEFPKLDVSAEQRSGERQLPWTRRLGKFELVAEARTPLQPVGLQVCDARGIYALQSPSLLQVFSVRTRRRELEFRKCEDVSCFALHATGRMALLGDAHGTARLLSLDHRAVLKDMQLCRQRLRALCFEPRGDRFCAASDAGELQLWDYTAGMEVSRLPGAHADVVRRICFAEEGSCVLTASLDRTLKLFDLRSGECAGRVELAEEAEDADLLDDGRLCAVHGRRLSVWDWRCFARAQAEAVMGAKSLTAVRAVEGLILTAGNDGFLRCFDAVATGGRLEALGHRQFDSGIPLFDADRRLRSLAVVTFNGGLRVLAKGQVEEEPQPRTADQVLLARLRQGVLARDTTSRKFFARGRWQKAVEVDVRIEAPQPPRFTAYEKLLRKFRFAEALAEALGTRNTAVIVAMVESLAARGSLAAAVEGLEEPALLLLLGFCHKKLDSHSHYIEAQKLLGLALGTAGEGLAAPVVRKQLAALRVKVEEEVAGGLLSGEIYGLIEGLGAQLTRA